jgi:type IV pilus assembly protein PilC
VTTYSYVIASSAGKESKGNVSADSYEQAMEELKKRGGTVISLQEAGALSRDVQISFLSRRPKPRDLSVFCRQFVSIVDAGVPMLSALEMLGEQTQNKVLCAAIIGCKQAIEKGSSLADAMRDYPKVFSGIFVTLVEAGEASGSISNSFNRMAEQFEKQTKLNNMVRKATIYPVILLAVTAIVVVILLGKVVPTFKDMLTGLGTELPGLTKFVVACSDGVQKWWYILLAIVVGIVVFIRAFKRTETGRYFFGRLERKMPLFGPLAVRTASARFARTMSTLIGAGIPMIDALEITANTMTNVYFKDAILEARSDVAMGTSLSEPLQRCGMFPPLVYHMVGIGEETGNIDGMLTKLADYYDEEVEAATQSLAAAMEPAIIIILAGVVGTIVLSVILPMASMYSALENI